MSKQPGATPALPNRAESASAVGRASLRHAASAPALAPPRSEGARGEVASKPLQEVCVGFGGRERSGAPRETAAFGKGSFPVLCLPALVWGLGTLRQSHRPSEQS